MKIEALVSVGPDFPSESGEFDIEGSKGSIPLTERRSYEDSLAP